MEQTTLQNIRLIVPELIILEMIHVKHDIIYYSII